MLGFTLEMGIRRPDRQCARNGRFVLLSDMRQFMRDEPPSGGTVRLVLAFAEDDMVTDRETASCDSAR